MFNLSCIKSAFDAKYVLSIKRIDYLFSVLIHVTNHSFLTWMFLRHYGGQLKTAVEKESGKKIDYKD